MYSSAIFISLFKFKSISLAFTSMLILFFAYSFNPTPIGFSGVPVFNATASLIF